MIAQIRRMAEEGIGVKQISELLGERHQVAKREVYRLALSIRNSAEK